MKNVLTPLAKSVLLELELVTTLSTIDATIQKKNFASETALIILNEEMGDIIRKLKYFKATDILIKSEVIKNEIKEQGAGFLVYFLVQEYEKNDKIILKYFQ